MNKHRDTALYSFRSLTTEKLREIVNSTTAARTLAWDLAAEVLTERDEKFNADEFAGEADLTKWLGMDDASC